MFAKPFKLKATVTLKNSDKKILVQRILETFPAATEGQVKDLVPLKSITHSVKLLLHSHGIVDVYVVDNQPIMIETEDGLVPTVCTLWKIPQLLPTITIHTPVLAKMLGGAPLYLPGVVMQRQGVGFPMFAKGTLIAACTADNKAIGVVGRAAMGSADMLLRANGACLETLHIYGDLLCREPKFDKVERPALGDAPQALEGDSLTTSLSEMSIQPEREAWPALGRGFSAPHTAVTPRTTPTCPSPAPHQPHLIADAAGAGADHLDDSLALAYVPGPLEEEEASIPSDMDGLLRWSVLCFLKLQAKHVELPLKTNLLYKNFLFPLCPPDRILDVKKSSYKKMSKFLEAMQREGLLEVKEIDKGVDAVVSVNLAHPLVRGHVVPAELKLYLTRAKEPKEGEKEIDYSPPEVKEMLCVTAAVAGLFKDVKKGTPLPPSEVRSALSAYVRARGLAGDKGGVTLNETLANVLGLAANESIKWEELMAGVAARMTSATALRWADGGERLVKAKLEPVSMNVVTRSGNKKVTLVSNLEAYGFHLPSLARTCQLGAGAACGVTRSPGARADQLMLQGDQTHFVAKLLVEKYGVPKKFVDGADKALKKKK